VGDDVSFLIAAAVAVVVTPVLARIGARLGAVDRPGELKIHDTPVPITGGPAVVAAVLLAWALVGEADAWVAAAACLAVGGGLVDDVRSLPPWVRLVVQAAAGGLLVAGGLRLAPFEGFGAAGLVVATVACCNAVNMLDGQDGLVSGLGAIAALGLAALLVPTHSAAALPLSLAGGLVGFVVWNRPPARVFLGDGGAYAVGVLIAASAAQVTTAEGWHGLLAAGACLGVFAYELTATIVRRLASASPAARGDRDHSYDRLGVRLRSRPSATFVMWGLGIVTALVALAVLRVSVPAGLALIAATLVATALLDTTLLPASIVKGDR
jgi:UDP-GlcNAc:undecaprenyl-phosphate GlcNAc-1-phosphate transferase